MSETKISQLQTALQNAISDDGELAIVLNGDTYKVRLDALFHHGGLIEHLSDADKHRVIDDNATGPTALLSAQKILALLANKAASNHNHNASNITAGTLSVARGGTGLNSYSQFQFPYASENNVLGKATFNTNQFGFSNNVLSLVADAIRQKVGVHLNGSGVGDKPIINLIEGGGITLTVEENGDAIDVTIAAGSGVQYIILEDQKPDGTGGGTYTSGAARTRDINTIVRDDTGLVTVSGNQFQLPEGDYLFHVEMPFIGNASSATGQFFSAAWLWNNNTSTRYGKNQWQNDEAAGGKTQQFIPMSGAFSNTDETHNWEIQLQPGFSYADNGGVDDGIAAGVEIYTRIVLIKVA